MSAIIIENGLAHYEAIGRGKPLILLHGWLGSWRYWMSTMDDLSDGFRTYALDLWGFGDSDRRGGEYSLISYVLLLQRFMDEMGIGRVPLIGHALGGAVALRFAAMLPERVEQVIAVCTPVGNESTSRTYAALASNHSDLLPRIVGRRPVFTEVQMEVGKTDSSAVLGSLRSIVEEDLSGDLEVLDEKEMPVLLLYGRQDPLIGTPDERLLSRFAETTRTLYLEESRHFPMLEETNKFTRLLRQFLEFKHGQPLEVKEEWRRRMR